MARRKSRKSRKISKSRPAKRVSRKKTSSKKGIRKPVPVSKALQKALGVPANVARTEVVKKIWAYAKKHKIQDKNDGRIFILDDNLAKLFGKKKGTKIHGFKDLPKQLNKHFL